MQSINSILYQMWFCITSLSAVAATFIAVIILQQKVNTEHEEEVKDFKKAVAISFFGVAAEILARFISLLLHTTYYPTSEIIICCLGRLIEAIGLWGLVLYMIDIWPFNDRD